eukprot:4374694-Prymnesium_polylepis.1
MSAGSKNGVDVKGWPKAKKMQPKTRKPSVTMSVITKAMCFVVSTIGSRVHRGQERPSCDRRSAASS